MDAYELLGLSPTATLAEAEDAYKRLLRQHHPDLHQHEGPEAVAAAELRTAALNAAIRHLRATIPTRVTATFRAAPFEDAGTSGPAADPGAWDPYDDRPWDTAPEAPPDEAPRVACPLCQELFASSGSLRTHAADVHGMQLERLRKRRRRRRMAPLPILVLLPLNGIVALVVAAVVTMLFEDTTIAAWVFALTMAPSAIRLFTQDD